MKRILFTSLIIINGMIGCSQSNNSQNITETRNDDEFEIIYSPNGASYSDSQLKIISTNPELNPNEVIQRDCINILSGELKSNLIESTSHKNIAFIDPGSNFESVECNICSKEIEMDEWQRLMDEASLSNFKDLSFITSCCQNKTSLNNLKYFWPAGFAKYEIIIYDPPDNEDVIKRIIERISIQLKSELRLVWAHY